MTQMTRPTLHRPPHLWAYAAIALGLQAIQATNGAFLAPLLESMGTSPFRISVILSLDPITCLLVVPWVSVLSDRTAGRWGRRLPFIAVGVLLAAVGVAGIGLAGSPLAVAAAMVGLYVGQSAIWGPYRTTLGEVVPSERHTTATGLQGLCQGIGTLAAMGGGGWLLAYGPGRPFFLAAGLMLGCGAITVAVLSRATSAAPVRPRPLGGFLAYVGRSRDLQWLLAAQTCWWAAMAGVSAFVVLFITHDVLPTGTVAGPRQAVGVLVLFAVVTMLAAVPTGLLATRFGRARILRGSLLLLALGFLWGTRATDLASLRLAMVLSGLGFAGLQVIPTTLFAELQLEGHEGAVMSLQGIFTDGPLMLGYLLTGWLIGLSGSYRVPFALGTGFAVVAWLCLGRLQTTGRALAVRQGRV